MDEVPSEPWVPPLFVPERRPASSVATKADLLDHSLNAALERLYACGGSRASFMSASAMHTLKPGLCLGTTKILLKVALHSSVSEPGSSERSATLTPCQRSDRMNVKVCAGRFPDPTLLIPI
jgi:hypothetical protein